MRTRTCVFYYYFYLFIYLSPLLLFYPPILPTLCLHGVLRTRLTPCAPCCSFCCMYLLSLFGFWGEACYLSSASSFFSIVSKFLFLLPCGCISYCLARVEMRKILFCYVATRISFYVSPGECLLITMVLMRFVISELLGGHALIIHVAMCAQPPIISAVWGSWVSLFNKFIGSTSFTCLV